MLSLPLMQAQEIKSYKFQNIIVIVIASKSNTVTNGFVPQSFVIEGGLFVIVTKIKYVKFIYMK